MSPGDRAGLVVFASRASTEVLPREGTPLGNAAAAIPRDSTDVGAGIRRALADLPSDYTGRVVVVSDGVENRGDAIEAAALAAGPWCTGARAPGWGRPRAGECGGGLRYARRGLRLGTQDAMLHFRAGMAAACAGERAEARELLASALALEPGFSLRWAPVAERELGLLEG